MTNETQHHQQEQPKEPPEVQLIRVQARLRQLDVNEEQIAKEREFMLQQEAELSAVVAYRSNEAPQKPHVTDSRNTDEGEE